MTAALVTGGAGFIGSHVAQALAADGVNVVVLDDMSGGFWRHVPSRAKLVIGSISDKSLVDELFDSHRFDYVFHLAAYAAEGLSHFIRRFNYETNLLGSIALINASILHDVKCFVFTSSAAVYGEQPPPHREESPILPSDPYGISKWAVEQDLRAASRMFGLKHVIFRPHNVYGERQNLSDPYRNVVGIFMNQVLRDQPCTVFGDGSQTRSFTYIGDIVNVITRSATMPEAHGQTFNIGASKSCTVLELAGIVQESLDRRVGVRHLPPRMEANDVRTDHSAVERVFGPMNKTPLREGIKRMADWAVGIVPKPPQPFLQLEIQRNLPLPWARLS